MAQCVHCPKCFTPTSIQKLAGHCSTSCIALHMWRRMHPLRPLTILPIRRYVEETIRGGHA